MGNLVLNTEGTYQGLVETGAQLAATSMAEGGWLEYFSESDNGDLRIEDRVLRAHTAIMLENSKRWLFGQGGSVRDRSSGRMVLSEATRAATVGGFSDFLFPVIRASFVTNPIHELVSVQPTSRRSATIMYWNWVVGTDKGEFRKGQILNDATTGRTDIGQNYTGEFIGNEGITELGSAGVTHGGTLIFNDGGGIRAGSVQLTLYMVTAASNIIFVDNGRGGFVSAGATISASSINYLTGAWSITISGDTFSTAATNVASYRYDSEGSSMIPEVTVQITSTTVETERRAMQLNYSQEAAHDMMAEFGQSLEPQLMQGCAEELNFETARQIIAEIWDAAPIVGTFDYGPSSYTGVTQKQRLGDLAFTLNAASNNIQKRTRKGYGNWIVGDELACTVMESMGSTFVAAPKPANVQGLHYVGMLAGKYKVYKDLSLTQLPGSVATGNMLMGFKGTMFHEAGLVWSPLNLLYTTQSLTRANFMTEKGFASRYATKLVNPHMYARISLLFT